MVRNATSFAPTFPGVGIGETDMYKNTWSDKTSKRLNPFKLNAL